MPRSCVEFKEVPTKFGRPMKRCTKYDKKVACDNMKTVSSPALGKNVERCTGFHDV